MSSEPISREEYERRWKAHFTHRTGWGDAFARDSWDAVTFEEHAEGFESDPEGSVEEELSYWGDGA